MFAIDTNILVYAHNADSKFNQAATAFLETAINQTDANGNFTLCIPAQVLTEFINVMTWEKLPNPLTLAQAIIVVEDYLQSSLPILNQRETQFATFLELLAQTTSRKRIFDVALAATLKDNNISGIYTVNVNDFKAFKFLTVINPLLG